MYVAFSRAQLALMIGLVLSAESDVTRAENLIGITSGFSPGSAPIVQIDSQTGQFTTITTGSRSYNALAQNSIGQLFGAWFSGSGENGRISRFDPITGSIQQTFDAVTPGSDTVRGLAFDSSDQLFAIVNQNDISGSPTVSDDLFTFDLASESTALIGSLGFTAVQGLDISPSGEFYAWDIFDGLLTVDPLTGAATDLNPTIGGTADIQSIVFAPDGTLFGANENLYEIDPATGAFTQIGSGSGLDVRGIEFIVPEPSTFALLPPILLLCFLRKRKK